MTIGFDFRMGGVEHGGIGRYAFELLKNLLTQNTEHDFVVFYNPEFSSESEIAELVKNHKAVLVATSSRHYSLSEQFNFLRLLLKHHLDLVHFPNFNLPIFYNKPFVVTIHDVVHHKISGHKKSRYYKFLAYKKVIETAARRSKKIITVSEGSKADIVKTFDVPPEKVVVTYEASTLESVDNQQIGTTKNKFLLRRPYFLFVGTLERKKNIVTLAKAFDLFLSKYNLDMDLVFAGKIDRHYPEIKFQALDIEHKNRLVFTDFVSNTDLAALIKGAFAYVNASLHEGFGLPGVEAMQFGIPLAVSNLSVFNEIYDNAALYFDPTNLEDIAEKLYLLAKDQQFHSQMQEKSLARGAFFDWAKTAKETLAVYDQVSHELLNPSSHHHEPIRE